MRTSRACFFVLALAAATVAPACALTTPSADSYEEPVAASWSGLSEKQTLLTAEQYARLEQDLTTSINATKAEIAALQQKITATEQANQAALTEINDLVNQIQRRRDELESQRNTSTAAAVGAGIFGFFLGGPLGFALGAGAVGAGAYAIDRDSELHALDGRLTDARARQAKAQADLAAYTAKKAQLQTHLDDLQTKENAVLKVLADSAAADPTPTSATPTTELSKFPSVGKRARKIALLGTLLTNLQDQKTSLESILALAQTLSTSLQATVTDLQNLRNEADAMVAAGRRDIFKILALLMTADPMSAATAWLEASIANRAKEVLTELGVPALDFAKYLVDVWDKGQSLAANPTDAMKTELVNRVVTAINGATGAADWTAIVYTEQQLVDAATNDPR